MLFNPFINDGKNWFERTFGTMSGAQNYSSFVDGNYENILNQARQQAIEDRDYNSMREDTYYQRMMNSMQQAGINPLVAYAQGGPSSMPLNQNSNIAGSSETTHKILQGYLQILDKVRASNLEDAEKWSKIARNVGNGLGSVI